MNSTINDYSRAIGTSKAEAPADLVCLSHLRWDFVYQRPQHLLSRFARHRRVFFVEEPVYGEGEIRLDITRRDDGVYVVVPRLPDALRDANLETLDAVQRVMIDSLFSMHRISEPLLWYYTPMAVNWTSHLKAAAVVYDCMDELSAFKGAPPALALREEELFSKADLVFTGGQSLYEAKRDRHPNIYPFPSSIDAVHFVRARCITSDPEDQQAIPRPRLGFFGVIDERFDTELLAGLADARPDWHLVMIGPVVKIDPDLLPQRPNIHYLGGKTYAELPAYLAGWDVALLPFARNDSTRFISPTKTPEYLAAGKPVVSTSIRDVVRPYGQLGLVRIADTTDEFAAACAEAMNDDAEKRMREVDAFLAETSWDKTRRRMNELIDDVVEPKRAARSDLTAEIPARAGGRAQAATASNFATGD